jgi:carbon-monoxide dehydrogenase iron sulfur subunit
MYIDEATGKVVHNQEKCIGCWTCVMVCPFGAVIVEPNVSRIPFKCDFCINLETPACVANCPNEALVLEEVDG